MRQYELSWCVFKGRCLILAMLHPHKGRRAASVSLSSRRCLGKKMPPMTPTSPQDSIDLAPLPGGREGAIAAGESVCESWRVCFTTG